MMSLLANLRDNQCRLSASMSKVNVTTDDIMTPTISTAGLAQGMGFLLEINSFILMIYRSKKSGIS